MLKVALGGLLLLTGCAEREQVVYRQHGSRVVFTERAGEWAVCSEAPPATIVETVTVAPGPGFVWIRGLWVWRGHWAWQRGHWVRPPRAGAVWVPHRYVNRGGVHVFTRGGWR
jgi:hypothetical protein